MESLGPNELIHWGRVMHICVSKLDNNHSFSYWLFRCQAIICANVALIVTNKLREQIAVACEAKSKKKKYKWINSKVSSTKYRQFYLRHHVFNKGMGNEQIIYEIYFNRISNVLSSLTCAPRRSIVLQFFDMLTPVPYHHFFSSLILFFIYV